jgi:hypothetical protein
MRRVLPGVGILIVVAVLLVLGHLAFIEIGREVVTLRTQRPDGTWQSTRLWIVDSGGTPWLHSGGASWLARFEGDPVVELERGGRILRLGGACRPRPASRDRRAPESQVRRGRPVGPVRLSRRRGGGGGPPGSPRMRDP